MPKRLGNSHVVPVDFLLSLGGDSVQAALEVAFPIQTTPRRDRYEGTARGAPIEKKLRPIFVRCPVPMAAGNLKQKRVLPMVCRW